MKPTIVIKMKIRMKIEIRKLSHMTKHLNAPQHTKNVDLSIFLPVIDLRGGVYLLLNSFATKLCSTLPHIAKHCKTLPNDRKIGFLLQNLMILQLNAVIFLGFV